MKVKELLHELLRIKDMDQDVVVHTVDINPYNGMHELRDAGPAVGAYEDGGAFVIEGEVSDPDEWEEQG